jgi:hypothetical protein
MTTFLKDPDAVLDYSVDWSKWLAGDQIATSTWFVSDPALQPADDSKTTTRTTIWLAGGVVGQSYTVTNRIAKCCATSPASSRWNGKPALPRIRGPRILRTDDRQGDVIFTLWHPKAYPSGQTFGVRTSHQP